MRDDGLLVGRSSALRIPRTDLLASPLLTGHAAQNPGGGTSTRLTPSVTQITDITRSFVWDK